jgi:hypothetical protein
LTFVSKEESNWKPLKQAEFAAMPRGRHVGDRTGRVWTIHFGPFEREGWPTMVITSGALVRYVLVRHADDYMAIPDTGPGADLRDVVAG